MIYTADHEPAHVHCIRGDDFMVVVLHCLTKTVSVRESVGLKRSEEPALAKFVSDTLSCCAKHGESCMISGEEFEEAERRGRQMLDSVPRAVEAKYVSSISRIIVRLSNGSEIAVSPQSVPALQKASPAELSEIELHASGYELYFPNLDEGLWIPNLLESLLDVRKYLAESLRAEATVAAA